jgi:hypothetical protein
MLDVCKLTNFFKIRADLSGFDGFVDDQFYFLLI